MPPTVINIARNAARPGWGREMLHKVWLRFSERNLLREREQSTSWCRKQEVDAGSWAMSIDPVLWQAAETFASEQERVAERRLAELRVKMGGGGFYALLYFLTRLLKPATIVETGVACGYSSRAFLLALDENGQGQLFSSDFPYFRLANPEQYVGCLVEPELRDRWTLLIGSDRDNLPKIARMLPHIDLLHYDSDKSVSGRQFALQLLSDRLGPESLVLFDDIQDNRHFMEWTETEGADFLVFEFKGKWIGVTGGPASLYSR